MVVVVAGVGVGAKAEEDHHGTLGAVPVAVAVHGVAAVVVVVMAVVCC